MALKQRFQNPVCGDEVKLLLFVYNSNNRSDVQSIEKVDIYFLDPTEKTEENPLGKRFVESITDITQEETGQYSVTITAESPNYTIGTYLDEWTIIFEDGECATTTVENHFKIYPDLWFTSPVPPIYDFNFSFRPNRIVKGSKRYITVQITPNVPRGSDIQSYYENLAIVSDIRVSLAISCGECVPQEQDLRLVLDRELIDYREKCYAYWFLDTTELDEGIYDVWFETSYGEAVFVSEKNQIQIS